MESTPLNILFALSAGVALAAATGFRAFLPVFALGVAGRVGWTAIRPAEQWLAGDLALIALGTATVVELVADKIPVVDHALDALATIIRPVAAWVVSFGVLTPLGQEWAGALATLLAGGAFGVHALKAQARVGSSMTTVGVANPLLSVIEDLISFTLTLAGILAPILAVMFLVLLGWLAIKILRKISPITQPRASSS
jgi:uncharacterized membrane protein